MLTYKNIQDAVLARFSEAQRTNAKEWIQFVYGGLWSADEWTFKQASANVQITAGKQTVTGLPGDLGVPHALLNTNGIPLEFLDWRQFQVMHNGETGTAIPWDWTIMGSGFGASISVGPPSSETASYTLLYERERGFYPGATCTNVDGTLLPQATLSVGFSNGSYAAAVPTSGTVVVAGQQITYTGTSSLSGTHITLTGCTGGIGSLSGDTFAFVTWPQAGDMKDDLDIPMLPFESHQILVHAAMAVGQTGENDYSLYLSDDRVQQGLNQMRSRYLLDQRGGVEQWGSYAYAHVNSGGGW